MNKPTVFIPADTPSEIIKAFPEYSFIFLVDDVAIEPWEMTREELRQKFERESLVPGISYDTEAFTEYHKRLIAKQQEGGAE